MKSLGVICARAGSKGLPGKNVVPFLGEPLIVRTVKTALRSIKLSNVVVSTDCEHVKRLVDRLVEVVDRPAEFAQDDSPIHEAVIHALDKAEEEWDEGRHDNVKYDAVVCLQNSSPFRLPQDIDRSLGFLEAKPDIGTVLSVIYPGHYQAFRMDAEGGLYWWDSKNHYPYRRQDAKDRNNPDLMQPYYMSGLVYAMRTEVLRKHEWIPCGKMMGMTVPEQRSMDIHTLQDLRIAEALAKGGVG